ncbi:hypothetical protein HAX54_003925 [Datura stramonium]|uniref:Putative plant transposon protein domain-containing protein n=1 Tax=Datura stramonium TaxID=4076 RepID=A0ABS8WSI3_DATST|nr:hypothetical protein [Datura stramonium]
MPEVARTWGRFVSSRLIPYLNTSNYEIEGVLLIYPITQELPVNVGRFISKAMVNCHFKGDCRCLYFPSTITHLVSLFDVNLEGLPNIENTYFIVRNFIDGLNPPAGPTKDVQEKIIIESLEKTENEIAQPEHSEVGTTPTAFLPDILVSLNQLSQKQNEMAENLESKVNR